MDDPQTSTKNTPKLSVPYSPNSETPVSSQIAKKTAPDECQANPFCFNGESSFWPDIRAGWEAIFGQEYYGQFNLAIKPFFYNRDPFSLSDQKMFGLAPTIQLHLGSARSGGSIGFALRYLSTYASDKSGNTGSFALDLGLRGGIGRLELDLNGTEQPNYFEGPYQFISAELLLNGRFSILSGYLGIGLRKEFWPDGTDARGDTVNASGSNLYPSLLLGGGLF